MAERVGVGSDPPESLIAHTAGFDDAASVFPSSTFAGSVERVEDLPSRVLPSVHVGRGGVRALSVGQRPRQRGRDLLPSHSGGLPDEHHDAKTREQARSSTNAVRASAMSDAVAFRSFLSVPRYQGTMFQRDDIRGAIDLGLVQERPHVLRRHVVVVGRDEARSPALSGRAGARSLEQQEDRRLHTGFRRIEPRDGSCPMLLLKPFDERAQGRDVRSIEQIIVFVFALAIILTYGSHAAGTRIVGRPGCPPLRGGAPAVRQ